MRHEGRELPNASLSIFTPAELRVIRVIFSVMLSEGQCTNGPTKSPNSPAHQDQRSAVASKKPFTTAF
jgi:hypothetical protein